jgi:hypothetical protein
VSGHVEQASLALRAAAVETPGVYSWFGRRSRPLPAAVLSSLSASAARAHLVQGLEDVLYRSFYTQGAPVPLSALSAMPAPPDPTFVSALSRSNAGRGGWEAGWHIQRVEPQALIVVADGLLARAAPADCQAWSGSHTAGTAVSVRRPKEHRWASPGFYTALGDAEPADGPDDLEVRVYFHLTSAGAPPLIAHSTTVLNRAGLPFVLKVVDNPAGYVRCDAAVLYLDGDGFRRARTHLQAIAAACEAHLRAPTPAFTKRLADGVALAEHRPASGASFGASRCRLLAESIVDAYERGVIGLDACLAAATRRFSDNGLSLELPYLAPGSEDRYVL